MPEWQRKLIAIAGGVVSAAGAAIAIRYTTTWSVTGVLAILAFVGLMFVSAPSAASWTGPFRTGLTIGAINVTGIVIGNPGKTGSCITWMAMVALMSVAALLRRPAEERPIWIASAAQALTFLAANAANGAAPPADANDLGGLVNSLHPSAGVLLAVAVVELLLASRWVPSIAQADLVGVACLGAAFNSLYGAVLMFSDETWMSIVLVLVGTVLALLAFDSGFKWNLNAGLVVVIMGFVGLLPAIVRGETVAIVSATIMIAGGVLLARFSYAGQTDTESGADVP
jgi:hypothetical protein